mmetsp:Transcript_15141/g.20896  ORF Transcript_15141/g.20896 Transcript_15141/m.20896 type:complete len:106 (+) Transcript_15141:180-497(+)
MVQKALFKAGKKTGVKGLSAKKALAVNKHGKGIKLKKGNFTFVSKKGVSKDDRLDKMISNSINENIIGETAATATGCGANLKMIKAPEGSTGPNKTKKPERKKKK